MNDRNFPEGSASGSDLPEDVRTFFREAAKAAATQGRFGAAAPAAMRRLARAAYGHDNSQALTVAAALASIYNGGDARPVRLDEIRWLDFSLQVDLVTVMLGTGHAGFEDVAIREAFYEVGGQDAVNWLHWHTTGGPHRRALKHIVEFIKAQRASAAVPGSDCGMLVSCLRSIVNHKGPAELGQLTYLDRELAESFLLVLDGLWGRDKGVLDVNQFEKAFEDENLTDLLSPAGVAKA